MKKQYIMDDLIVSAGAIAVVQTSLPAQAVYIAKELLKNNVKAMEIAYRDLENLDGSDECIRAVRETVPEMLIGAATVTSPKLARRAIKAGAQFILSAGFNPKTVSYCVRKNFPVYPGIAVPGEIEQAMAFGLKLLKIFPVSVLGGTSYLKALSGPYPEVNFIVSGGLNAKNEDEYRTMNNVAAVSGSYLCTGF